jgi:hypothetical protein
MRANPSPVTARKIQGFNLDCDEVTDHAETLQAVPPSKGLFHILGNVFFHDVY